MNEHYRGKKGSIKLCLLLRGDCVGFEDILFDKKRTFNFKCTSMDGGKLYSIKKEVKFN